MPISHVENRDCMEAKNPYWLGKKHKPETIERMRIARLKNNPMKNPDSVKKRSKTLITNKIFSGSRNPKWSGGGPNYRGDAWKKAKEERRKLDNYTCQDCGKQEMEGKRRHDVHHIIEFKDGGGNELTNLKTLCRSCHNKTRAKNANI